MLCDSVIPVRPARGETRDDRRRQPPSSRMLGGHGCWLTTLAQRVEERPCSDQIGRVEAFLEALVNGLQDVPGLAGSALSLPEAGEARRAPQLPRERDL